MVDQDRGAGNNECNKPDKLVEGERGMANSNMGIRKISSFVVALAIGFVAFGVGTGVARAESVVSTSEQAYPFEITLFNPCMAGEIIPLSGSILQTSTVVTNEDGAKLVRTHSTFQGVSGVSSTTGTRYVLNGPMTSVTHLAASESTILIQGTFRLVGQGLLLVQKNLVNAGCASVRRSWIIYYVSRFTY